MEPGAGCARAGGVLGPLGCPPRVLMYTTSISLLAAALAGTPTPWAELPWGEPLPGDLLPETDWPWAGDEGARCGWREELLLCDDGAGLSRAYRAWEGPVEGGAPAWVRCAGLEWCAGELITWSEGGRSLGRWASRLPPHRGWEWSLPAPLPQPAPGDGSAVLSILGGEVWGAEAIEALAARLGSCRGAAGLERFPLEVIYDEQGPRKVRLQGRPPPDLDPLCLVYALSLTPRPAGGEAVELMVSGI